MKKYKGTQELKSCSKCSQEKLITEFNIDKQKKSGYCSVCKQCKHQEYRRIHPKPTKQTYQQKLECQKQYRQENKEKISETKRQWRKNNWDKVLRHSRESYLRNKERKLKQQQQYRLNNPKVREYTKIRSKHDLLFRLTRNLRSRFKTAMIREYKTGSAVRDLGCSIKELKQHLENQFQDGMNWNNYGLHGWHIDHIKPLAKFDLTDPEQVKQACHYTNLQPLWAKDNISKGAK